jgi:hypothetical protein
LLEAKKNNDKIKRNFIFLGLLLFRLPNKCLD